MTFWGLFLRKGLAGGWGKAFQSSQVLLRPQGTFDHTHRLGRLLRWHGGSKGPSNLGVWLRQWGRLSSYRPFLLRRPPPEDRSMEYFYGQDWANTKASTGPTSYVAELHRTAGGLDFSAVI